MIGNFPQTPNLGTERLGKSTWGVGHLKIQADLGAEYLLGLVLCEFPKGEMPARLQQKSVRYGKMSDAKVRKYGKMSHFTSDKYYLPEKGSVCVRCLPTKLNIFLGNKNLRDRDFGFESRVGD